MKLSESIQKNIPDLLITLDLLDLLYFYFPWAGLIGYEFTVGMNVTRYYGRFDLSTTDTVSDWFNTSCHHSTLYKVEYDAQDTL